MKINLRVNGVAHQSDVEPRLLLVHYLRDILGLTGTHVGCETSLCGACTIMIDGQAVKSCTMFAVQADGAEIKTIEGFEVARVQYFIRDKFRAIEIAHVADAGPGVQVVLCVRHQALCGRQGLQRLFQLFQPRQQFATRAIFKHGRLGCLQ